MRKVRDMEFYRHKFYRALRIMGEVMRENNELREQIAAYKNTIAQYQQREANYLNEIDRLRENN